MSASPPTPFVFEEIQSNARFSTPLAIFLEKLDAIPSSTIPSGFIRNTKLLNSLYAKKQLQIDAIVGDFASLYTLPINFLALFDQRMTACGNTLTKTQTEHYINVLDFYLQFKILNNENRVAAKSLLTYLETHQADPDNSLIGLTPSKSILENLQTTNEDSTKGDITPPKPPDGPFHSMFTTQELIEMILRWDEMSDDDAAICLHQFAASARNHGQPTTPHHPLGSSAQFVAPGSPSSLHSSASVHSIPKTSSSPALLRSVSYSSLNNSYAASPPSSPSRTPSFSLFPGLFKKSIEFKLNLEKTAWKEGDVVVIFVGMILDPTNKEALLGTIKAAREEMNEDAFMFARVSDPCMDGEHNVGVYVDKNETKVRVVSKESVFVLKFEQATPSMVADVTQRFFGKLTLKLADRTNLFLVSQGLDLTVLERALVNDATVFDIPALQRNIACVHSLQLMDSIIWTNFLDSVRKYSESKVKGFVAEIEAEGRTFALSKKQILSQLHNFDYASIPAARLQSYLDASKTAIEALHNHAADILDGTEKHRLSEWYLEHIKQCVDEFLTRSGFELDVIPENYIDQAPKDLELVGKNWSMVRELLDIISSYDSKDQNKHEVIDVMTTLMDDIYTRLDEFVRDALFVISDKMGIVRDMFDMSENQDIYDELRKIVETKKGALAGDLREKIDELMKDVEYIFKIREMEGMQCDKSRDHVPISGLIASRFFRLENELRTSLDVWDPSRMEEAQATCGDETPPTNFENATLKVEAVQ
eukprot:Phypoly_transcript_02712.p1 GENE.Phypoly_transcript_02712~~Phypoly_transcript_02712.p1  ORF type:complete len:762 (+),score=166.98 Phypoly_transcript_02712:213-2498(+)